MTRVFKKQMKSTFHHLLLLTQIKQVCMKGQSPILNEKSILKRHKTSIVQAIYIFLRMNYTFYMSHFQCYVLPLI